MKTKLLNFRISENDYDDLLAESKIHGLTLSEYVRGVMDSRNKTINNSLDRKMRKNQEIYLKEVRANYFRIGNNINQIAKTLNFLSKSGEIDKNSFENTINTLSKIENQNAYLLNILLKGLE